MKVVKRLLLGILVVFLILQIPVFNPDKNYTEAKPVNDIAVAYEIPMDVQMHLYNACYDCHSNYTRDYPWYYNIQPVSWWMSDHIKKAKSDLNFSEFAIYQPKRAAHKLHEIQEVLEHRVMPLKSYLRMHDEALFTDQENQAIIDWAKKTEKQLRDKMATASN